MKRIIELALMLLVFCTATQAQIKVEVRAAREGNIIDSTIAQRLAGRIGLSSRYALVTDGSETILIVLSCNA
jgi:hypothetical protein